MKLDREDFCPLIKGRCKKLDCIWFYQLKGIDPETNETVHDEWNCAVNWLVKLTIENTKAAHMNASQTQEMRNEAKQYQDSQVTMSAIAVRNMHEALKEGIKDMIEPPKNIKQIT